MGNMNFKELFKNRAGISPIISVFLIVAIVIFITAITPLQRPHHCPYSLIHANIGATANSAATDTVPASVKIEHFDGDSIDFGNSTLIRVSASLNGADSIPINATCLNIMNAGDIKILPLTSDRTTNVFATEPKPGDFVNIKIIDLSSNQLLNDSDVKF
jgi:FlaG/FlaF family flagellin (archaellin)